ncbi:MAG: SusC/RagA family TonB-linked outer membrane protein [Ferruginibacter sp.]|nr:SusC/RagA family TonB-linked outer membrane protein [Ferruginibacter sp.]
MKRFKQRMPGLLFLLCSFFACTMQAVAQSKTDTISTKSIFVPAPLSTIGQESSITPLSSVSGPDLYQTPVANITNTLYGRLLGLTVKQGSGEPGYDNAALSIRGRGTYDNAGLIIYVDGFQTNSSYFSYLSASEIESISVLKDPVSLATFGMKGANGVLWVVTKRGTAGKPRVQVQVVSGLQSAININKPYGAYDYARLYNQAVSNDNYAVNGYQLNYTPQYTDAQLDQYKNGTGTNVDWFAETLKKKSPYTDANVILSGGDTNTRYGVILDYMHMGGLYNVPTSVTQSNAQIGRFNVRSNLDFKFFKIFEAKVDLGGRIEDRRYPNYGGGDLWNSFASYPANIYPVKDATGNWSGTTLFPNNPVAQLNALGWASTHDRTLQANFNLKERLDFITPGLYLNEAVSFNTWTRTNASKTATYARFYNGAQTTTDKTTDITSNGTSPTNQYDWKQINITAGYNRTFGVHGFAGAVNYFASDFVTDQSLNTAGDNTGNNIFYHFNNFGGRFNYSYDSRYLLELGFGYSGSDNYAPGNKWHFYPAVAAGWVISKEAFLKDSKTINQLKLRLSAGQSGNDQTNRGRYLYQQYFVSNGTFYTGNASLTGNNGVIRSYAANPDIAPEKSTKYEVGIDVVLLDKFSLTVNVFQDKRSGIVTQNNELLAPYGGLLPNENIGKVTNKGYEIGASFNSDKGPVSYSFGAMAAYAKNKIDYQAEIPTANDFSKRTGLPFGTPIGLVADGFFDVTDFNTNGTLKTGIPVPAFGAVQPGDIRYKDLDGNNKVDQNDVTQIGNAEYPTLTYSFNATVSYKGFDLSTLFQGAKGNDVYLIYAANTQTVAFVNNTNVFPIAQNAWAYYPAQGIDTRAVADYPRLTTKGNDNNYRNSTFWKKNGDFLRLRNAEIGYSLPAPLLTRMHIEKLRIYLSAVNPVTWSYLSKHYHIDPETNTGYPGLKSYNFGISLTF